MTVKELSERLQLQPLVMAEPDREVTGGYVGDLLSWVMGNARCGDAWVTIMSNSNIVAVATLADTAAVILAEGVEPDPGVRELAEQKGINLFSTSDSAFSVCGRLAALL